MIRNILILTFNDLAISFKNKTLYLILFIPLFVFVSLNFVDADEANARKIKIGLVEKVSYPPAMIQGLQSANAVFVVSWHSNEAAGKQRLKDRNGDVILFPAGEGA
mgnify:FL=1